jgi:hypothetical protein
MFSKKILFPMAAFAMASFVACGDDSSSGASDVAPASVPTFMDLGDVPCSATQNLCAQVLVVEHNDFYQCNGTQWNMMFNGEYVKGCENAAPAAETPADPAAQTPAAETPAAETPAAETPAAETPAAEAPAAETPAAETPAAETPAAETPAAETPATETPAEPAAETPATSGPVCYMASDVPGMAECIPLPADQCAAIMGEVVDVCPIN